MKCLRKIKWKITKPILIPIRVWDIDTNSETHTVGLYLMIGFFIPNLSIRTLNMTINQRPKKAICDLIDFYCQLEASEELER